MARELLTSSVAEGSLLRLVRLLEPLDRGGRPLLRVLTYHRVDEPDAQPDLSPVLLSATPETFARQMEHVARFYDVIGVERLLGYFQGSESLPKRPLVLTFDDAYQDFATHAWPVLKHLGLPVTLFVATAFPDQPERHFWWDRLYQAIRNSEQEALATPLGTLSLAPKERRNSFRKLRDYVKSLPHGAAMREVEEISARLGAPAAPHRVLGWEALRQLAREGVTVAPHSHTHPMLNRVTPEEAAAEALLSWQTLEREVGPTLPIFAYPSGGASADVVHSLAAAGFQLAFTTVRGINDLRGVHPLQLRRINVGRRTTLPLLHAQLLSCTIFLNRWLR